MRRLRYLFGLFSWGLKRILLYILAILAGFSCMLGGLTIYDSFQSPSVPHIYCVHCRDSGKPRPTLQQLQAMHCRLRWETMQEALCYLDCVCPAASEWVRERHASGHLVFDAWSRGLYGWYVPATGTLGVCLIALTESNAELACTLAHEYRHSRQGILRGVQVEIAKAFGVDRRFEFVEAEAYEFEERVRRAMRGAR